MFKSLLYYTLVYMLTYTVDHHYRSILTKYPFAIINLMSGIVFMLVGLNLTVANLKNLQISMQPAIFNFMALTLSVLGIRLGIGLIDTALSYASINTK